MKLVKFTDFQYSEQTNENIWDELKYGLSKLGTYKSGGKIFGKGKVKKEAAAEVEELLKKESNKVLKTVVEDVEKNVSPEFPNCKKKITFLRGIITYGQFYDTVVAATKKSPKEQGYLAPEVANEMIEALRKVVKRYLDVELKAVYTTFENIQNDEITEDEINELYNYTDELEEALNEEFIKKLLSGAAKGISKGYQAVGAAKDKAMDAMFGAKKGADAEPKRTGGQSAKLQATSGQKNVESERMKGLESNKLPMTLLGVGSALGAFSWLVNTDWFKSLFTSIEHTDKVEMVQQTVETKTQVLSTVQPNEGMTQILNKTLNINLGPNSSPDEFVAAVKQVGGGNVQDGINALAAKGGIFANDTGAKAALEEICKNPHGHGDTLKEVFSGKMAGTGKNFGDVFVTLPGKTLAGVIAKTIVTAAPKIVGMTAVKVGAGYATAKGLGAALGPIGLTLVAAGAVVKLLREKGQRQSRAKTLNDLLQSLVLVKKEEGKGETGGETDKESVEKEIEKPTEKSIYPLMIKNLEALKSLLISSQGVKLEDEIAGKTGQKVGKEKAKEKVRQPAMKESYIIRKFDDLILEKEKEFGKDARNFVIYKNEEYLTQSVVNIRKSIKSIIDEKDKGLAVDEKFISAILDKKMEPATKEPVKELYKEINSYLYGDKSKTIPDLGELYVKESVEVISNKSKRAVVAEKMARFAKRSLLFEKDQDFYGGLGEFGKDLQKYNTTLLQIMEYYKTPSKEEVKESRIVNFRNFNNY